MRKNKIFYAMIVLIAVLFAGCEGVQEKIIEPPKADLWVVNSAWEVVDEYVYTGDRAIQSLEAVEAYVDGYNATHNDDQLSILFNEKELEVGEAPDAECTIIFTDNNEVYATRIVPRDELGYTRRLFRDEVQTLKFNSGRPTALYVDKAPPVYTPPYVEPVDTRSDYEKYCFYIIDADGAILFEEHAPDGQDLIDYFMGDTTKTAKDWFDSRMPGIRASWRQEFPTAVQLIEGRIYTPPEPPDDPVEPEE